MFPGISWRNMDSPFLPYQSDESDDEYIDRELKVRKPLSAVKLEQGMYRWGNVFLIDTDREREISVGRDYPFDKLK